MPVVSELIRIEDDGTISFGNYELATKSKLQDFEYKGDLYKVKTYYEITKLERKGKKKTHDYYGRKTGGKNMVNEGIRKTIFPQSGICILL